MIAPAPVSDFEFLNSEHISSRHYLYLYRKNSGLLRGAIRRRIAQLAEQTERELSGVVPYRPFRPPHLPAASIRFSLHKTVTHKSLFGESLTIHDLGSRKPKVTAEDVEEALWVIADQAATQSLCLFVPEGHEVLKTDAWQAAVHEVGLIEEPMVTSGNYLSVIRAYLPQSRLGDLGHLSKDRVFQSRLRKTVDKNSCTPFALSMRADMIVLAEMDGGKFRESEGAENARKERWVLPETLRRFLDRRDPSSYSTLMVLVDKLRFDRMLQPDEILTRLYRATETTLERSDRRYRQTDDPAHCVWAALLLSHENGFRRGNPFLAMDYICQKYIRAVDAPNWIDGPDGWQVAAHACAQVEICPSAGRLDRARYGTQRALCERLMAAHDSTAQSRPAFDGTELQPNPNESHDASGDD